MPNWCYTNISFNSENKNDLEKLYNFIEKATSNKSKYADVSDFGSNWLGNILLECDLMTLDDVKNDKVPCRCRGSIIYVDITEDQVIVDTETAWVPMMQVWQRVVEKLNLDDVDIIYTAEEPGCELYLTNDPVVDGTYMIEFFADNDHEENIFNRIFGSDDDRLYELSQKDIDSYTLKAKEIFPNLKSLDDLHKYINDGYFVFNQYQLVDIWDLD